MNISRRFRKGKYLPQISQIIAEINLRELTTIRVNLRDLWEKLLRIPDF